MSDFSATEFCFTSEHVRVISDFLRVNSYDSVRVFDAIWNEPMFKHYTRAEAPMLLRLIENISKHRGDPDAFIDQLIVTKVKKLIVAADELRRNLATTI